MNYVVPWPEAAKEAAEYIDDHRGDPLLPVPRWWAKGGWRSMIESLAVFHRHFIAY